MRAVAQKTGVNPDTLRTWERRYHAVEPQRSAGGTRYYDEATVARIHLLRQATAQGHAISQMAGLSAMELQRIVRSGTVQRPACPSADVLEAMFRAIESNELGEFERLVGTAALAYTTRELMDSVLQPLLHEIGARWEDGRMSVSQEHAVSSSLRAVLIALMRSYQRPLGRPRLLLATLPDERHEFGILMLQLVAASCGVSVHYLGSDVPAQELLHTAFQLDISVIALSAVNTDISVHSKAELSHLLNGIGDSGEVWLGGRGAHEVAGEITDPRLHIMNDLFCYEQKLQLMKGQ